MRKPVVLPLLHGRLCQARGHPSCSRCLVWAPDSRVQRALEVMSVRRHRGPWWTRLGEPGSHQGVRAQPQSVDSGHQLRVAAAGGDVVAHEPVCSFGPRRACCVRAPHEQGGLTVGTPVAPLPGARAAAGEVPRAPGARSLRRGNGITSCDAEGLVGAGRLRREEHSGREEGDWGQGGLRKEQEHGTWWTDEVHVAGA